MPICRRGPVAIIPRTCGAMVMVVTPTVSPAEPQSTPVAADSTPAVSTPEITLTSASTDYEWNPSENGSLRPTRATFGPPVLAPEGNANIPTLGTPGRSAASRSRRAALLGAGGAT